MAQGSTPSDGPGVHTGGGGGGGDLKKQACLRRRVLIFVYLPEKKGVVTVFLRFILAQLFAIKNVCTL